MQEESRFKQRPITFKGRASRSEFCKGIIIFLVLTFFISYAAAVYIRDPNSPGYSVLAILKFILFIYVISITARRLHDVNKSGWWALLYIIPFVNLIFPIILMLVPGTKGPNRFDNDIIPNISSKNTTTVQSKDDIVKSEKKHNTTTSSKKSNLDLKDTTLNMLLSSDLKEYSGSEVSKALKKAGIKKLYHFTDINNIYSISRLKGLYSWDYLKKHGFSNKYFGGDSLSRKLDQNKDLQNYVHLSFCSDHPMAFRLQQEGRQLILLEIDVDILDENTKFSNMNAVSNDAKIGQGLSGLSLVDIKATQRQYVRRDDPDFPYHQAEALVSTFIPLSAILNWNEIIKNNEVLNVSESMMIDEWNKLLEKELSVVHDSNTKKTDKFNSLDECVNKLGKEYVAKQLTNVILYALNPNKSDNIAFFVLRQIQQTYGKKLLIERKTEYQQIANTILDCINQKWQNLDSYKFNKDIGQCKCDPFKVFDAFVNITTKDPTNICRISCDLKLQIIDNLYKELSHSYNWSSDILKKDLSNIKYLIKHWPNDIHTNNNIDEDVRQFLNSILQLK